MPIVSFARVTALTAGLAVALLSGAPLATADSNPCNPCGAKMTNPCNPCGAKMTNPCNPCGAKGMNPCNPCGAKGMNPCNPCGAKGMNPCNPCGAKGMNPCNPCGGGAKIDPAKFKRPAGLQMGGGNRTRLIASGKQLWSDKSLSTNGASCATCHANNAQFLPSFATPYPHQVAMVKTLSGVAKVEAVEMVQFCMLQPMQAKPLPWNSPKLAALAAYVENLQTGFKPNPCAMKSANPCNPCGAKNPCNPCGAKAKNPCNPCSR